MIKIQTTSLSLSGNMTTTETEITTEEASCILHDLSIYERSADIICESDEDKQRLARTYYDMYHDGFNIRHDIDDEEQKDLQLAHPAETDVFYVENLLFRFEAGIRALDPRYARVNTHETSFTFRVAPIYACIAINNAPDEQTRSHMEYVKRNIIHKHEQLNHLSYEDAREYLGQVWSAYQALFTDSLHFPDIDRIIAINKNYDLPWYDRLQEYY